VTAIGDSNGIRLRFAYRDNLIEITDAFGRRYTLALADGRVAAVNDHLDRRWTYVYDNEGRLVEVVQPVEAGDTLSTRYQYDDEHRLIASMDPRGNVVLVNTYDRDSRVVQQQHGAGTFGFSYEVVGRDRGGLPVLDVDVRVKSGARMHLRHNDTGQLIQKTVFMDARHLDVRAGTIGSVPVTTLWKHNRYGEVVARQTPDGQVTQWKYDDRQRDPRARGNLLSVTRYPKGTVSSSNPARRTTYVYDKRHQRATSVRDPRGNTTLLRYDERGNLTAKIHPKVSVRTPGSGRSRRTIALTERFQYNRAGQLTAFIDTRGSVTEYTYYPLSDPWGANGTGSLRRTSAPGGYLARLERHARNNDSSAPSLGYRYDRGGHVTEIVDGKGNATSLRYDLRGNITKAVSRAPFLHEVEYSYDANSNPIESRVRFQRNGFDPETRQIGVTDSYVKRFREYNALNNLVASRIVTPSGEAARYFVRDASENVVRTMEKGLSRAFAYNEEGLVTESRVLGVADAPAFTYQYGLSGRLRRVKADGQTTLFVYDTFNRLTRAQDSSSDLLMRFDANDNLVALRMDTKGGDKQKQTTRLENATFTFDELNRCIRVARALPRGLKLSAAAQSQLRTRIVDYDYAVGTLPSRMALKGLLEYQFDYDFANRPIRIVSSLNESIAFEYDANSNITEQGFARRGADGTTFKQRLHKQYDALDRVTTYSLNGTAVNVRYNEVGVVLERSVGLRARQIFLQDPSGRKAGRLYVGTNSSGIFALNLSGPGWHPDPANPQGILDEVITNPWLSFVAGFSGGSAIAKGVGVLVAGTGVGSIVLGAAMIIGGGIIIYAGAKNAERDIQNYLRNARDRQGTGISAGGNTTHQNDGGGGTQSDSSSRSNNPSNTGEFRPDKPEKPDSQGDKDKNKDKPPRDLDCDVTDDDEVVCKDKKPDNPGGMPVTDGPDDDGASSAYYPGIIRPVGPGVASDWGGDDDGGGASPAGGSGSGLKFHGGFTDPSPIEDDSNNDSIDSTGGQISIAKGYVDPVPDGDGPDTGISGETIKFMGRWGYTDPVPFEGLSGLRTFGL
jgi:YD repeat-containing protein